MMISSKLEDGVAVLTIERRAKANALPREAKRALAIAIDEAAALSEVSAIVITGEGDRAFCAGSDISEMRAFDASSMYEMLGAERAMYLAAIDCPKPVVAAVNGLALGAGMILVMSCDYAVASTHAGFGTPELTIGVAAPLEGFLLPLIVGLGKARAMFYTARRLSSDEALETGLVHELVPPAECLARATDAAREIGSLPSNGFSVQKSLLRRLVYSADLEGVIVASHHATSLQFARPETGAAMERFLSRSRN
jgi:enoyl-CoA hydratase/carnithine racemase